jgi:hypothetical protein
MKSKLLLITANLLMLLSISWSGGRIPSKHTGISSWETGDGRDVFFDTGLQTQRA